MFLNETQTYITTSQIFDICGKRVGLNIKPLVNVAYGYFVVKR